MIKIQGLNKFFNKGKQNQIHVINDITLDMPESGMVAIFGKSGCGKTTLLNVLGGLDSYESGSVTVFGGDIGQNTDDIRNKYIGYIFQNYNLNKNQTCFENIASALTLCGIEDSEVIDRRVAAALRNVDMVNYAARTPDTLSGGQQQRIAIARAIVKNPAIILADEPTGNLDEANTVMIMDLLKQISRDRLVILVTHEENLVDYYCDTVIELADGKVVGKRTNEAADGYAARGKNKIYLGELEKSQTDTPNTSVEFYGEVPSEPIKLKIVNEGGKLYIRIDSPNVQILDSSSEVKLCEGVYVPDSQRVMSERGVDMSDLPPIDSEGKRFGRMFTFKSAIKSGYRENFKRAKRGKKVLRACMCMFAAVMVLMSAVFGTAFGKLIDVKNSYNHNVFYVRTPDAETSEKLVEAMETGTHGVDWLRLTNGVPYGDSYVKFSMGFFESFSFEGYDEGFAANAVYLDTSLASGLDTVAGKSEGLSENEILVSTKVADELLDKSSLGYISEYKDLIGLSQTTQVNGKTLRIAGVVKSDETAIYLTELSMATYVLTNGSGLYVQRAEERGFEAAKGSTVFAVREPQGNKNIIPKAGDTVKIHGVPLEVERVIRYSDTYEKWLNNNGEKKLTQEEYFDKIFNEKYSDSEGEADEYIIREEIRRDNYYAYLEYYNDRIDEYMQEKYMFDGISDSNIWMYAEKGEDIVKYLYMLDGQQLYEAVKYKNEHGSYPEWNGNANKSELNEQVNRLFELYREEYNGKGYIPNNQISHMYFVADEDYIAFSKQVGETHETALSGSITSDIMEKDMEAVYIVGSSDMVQADVAYPSTYLSYSRSPEVYTVIHSSDPKATLEWIRGEFADNGSSDGNAYAMLTPDDIFSQKITDYAEEIITGAITMAVVIAVMSVCMYFIMRSSLLNRIKEVGILRAIGVSKRNLIFKFFVEALLITSLTVLFGYIVTSGFIFACLGMSAMMEAVFFYPVWLAAAVLGILYLICLFFGTLPVMSLLRKTPSEILAKYDI